MIFQSSKKPHGFLLYLALLGCFLLFLWIGLQRTEAQQFEKSCLILSESVRKSAVHCYAVEGQYPENLAYLEAHYGLTYNKKRFLVHYQPMGANLMPDIFVTGSDAFYAGD